MTEPGMAIGWLAVLCAIDMPSMGLYMMAARMCPAAVSATIDVGVRMVSGYFVQVVFFGGHLEPLTITGAAFMLSGVVAMANVRKPQPSEMPPTHDASAKASQRPMQDQEQGATQISDENVMPESIVAPNSSGQHQDEVESVASFGSFVASEFVDMEPESSKVPQDVETSRNSLRLRLSKYFTKSKQDRNAHVAPVARTIGAVV